MTELLEFISGLLDGAALFSLSLALGGLACTLVVLRPMYAQDPVVRSAGDVLLMVSVWSLCALAGFRSLQLAVKALALTDGFGSLGLQAVLQTRFFRFGAFGILLALGMAWSVARVRRDVSGRWSWSLVLLVAGLFMVNEAWLTHAASRLDHRGPFLMVATMGHMCGATVWAGGVVHMLLLRKMMRDTSAGRWPDMVARFSPLGMGCMGFIVGPGVFLSWQYVGSWAGLIGTGYGNVLLAKLALFVCVLALATRNWLAARQWAKGHAPDVLFSRVPSYLEVESLLAGVILFAAVSLTGAPPSVDETPVTFSEILVMYEPKVPHLSGPERLLVEAPELIDLETGEIGTKEDVSWDRFNHNVSGVIILVMGMMALFEQLGRLPWVRFWPLLFLGFSGLIVVFANPDHWPLGSVGFLASLQNPEVLQHWLAAILVFGLGWFEWLSRRQASARTPFQFVFPLLCIVGGMIMLTHSHGVMERKQEFLIQGTHVWIGVLAVLMGGARWLEIRLPRPYNRFAGLLSVLAMVLVGFVLLFYVKPLAA